MGIPDICAMAGNIYIQVSLSGNANSSAAVILFIRFLHFPAMFYPLSYYLRHHTLVNKKRENQILSIFQVFLLMIFLSHILACYLIILGKNDEDPEANSVLWIA